MIGAGIAFKLAIVASVGASIEAASNSVMGTLTFFFLLSVAFGS
jgi:hypothetical protein